MPKALRDRIRCRCARVARGVDREVGDVESVPDSHSDCPRPPAQVLIFQVPSVRDEVSFAGRRIRETPATALDTCFALEGPKKSST